MAAVLEFMDGPLVSWIRTLIPGGTVDFQELCDAVFLNDVLLTIDQREMLNDVKRDAKDSNARIQNWLVFLRNIKTHYQDVLQQLIVMDLPNVLAIVHEPDKDSSVRELKKVMLLLLGCAVQCEDKERYINAIKSLDIDTQAAIVGHIKEMTDSTENVISLHTGEETDLKTVLAAVRKMANHRDNTAEALLKLSQERDYYRRELEGKRGPLTPPEHLGTVHLYNELNKYKAQVNHFLKELEDKGKQVVETKEELESSKNALNKLKFQNFDLSKDAKSARAYRDELDMLREKAVKVDKLEKDLGRYKDKVNELAFYKSRVQELREDNTVLLEAKNKIEEQLTAANKRSENMVEDLVKAQLQLEEVSSEKERIHQKMEEIIEENAALEFERTNMSEGYRGGLKRMLSTSSDLFSGSNLQLAEHPISEELNDSINCKVAKLELDNEGLQREITEANQKLNDVQMELARMKADAEREYKRKVSDLELQTVELRKRNSVELADSVHQKIKEVERQAHEMRKRMTSEFQQKVQKLERVLLEKEKQMKSLQEDKGKDRHQVDAVEKRLEEVYNEKEKYKNTIEHMQLSSQGRIKQLEHEVSSLQALNASMKRRLSELSQNDLNKENTYVALEAERSDHRGSPSKHRHAKSLGRTQSLSQSFDTSDYVKMRYGSSRSSRGSTSSIHSIHEMDPRYVSSPKAHRSHRHSSSGHESDHERHRHKASSSRSSVSSAQMQTHEVPRSSVHTQSSPFVRGSAARSTAPARGVVAPQRRAPPPSPQAQQPQQSASSPFMRHDKTRIAVAPSRSKSTDIEPFSRDSRLRTTMPERKTVYVTPERRTPVERSESPDLGKLRYESPKRHSSSSSCVEMYHSLPLPDKHRMYASTTGVAMNSPTLEKSPSFHEKWKDCGSDSGHATSPESPESSTNFANGYPEGEKEKRRRQTSLEISSSETIRTQYRASTRNPQGGGEKWKYFVDKIVDLQDKNQKLFLENSDLKKVSNTQTFTSDLLRGLKERNLILEVENRKLKKIIEMLQGGGRNPNDPREYHFYTNV